MELDGGQDLLQALTQAGNQLGLLSGEHADEDTKAKLEQIRATLDMQAARASGQGDHSVPTVEMNPDALEEHLEGLDAQLNSLQATLSDIDAPTQQILAESMKVWAGQGTPQQQQQQQQQQQRQGDDQPQGQSQIKDASQSSSVGRQDS